MITQLSSKLFWQFNSVYCTEQQYWYEFICKSMYNTVPLNIQIFVNNPQVVQSLEWGQWYDGAEAWQKEVDEAGYDVSHKKERERMRADEL